ncbi:MAG: hypothetical protein ACP5KN_05580 [Armatimonadota bacterium]
MGCDPGARPTVAAAEVLRAAGVPAGLTYVPGGFIHGIVKLYLHGYGWVRMDATCGSAKLPLVREARDLRMARLFDMPIEMETIWFAYAWPYMQNDAVGPYTFAAEGRPIEDIGFVLEDAGHSISGLLAGIDTSRISASWQALTDASHQAVLSDALGEFAAMTELLPEARAHVRQAERIRF